MRSQKIILIGFMVTLGSSAMAYYLPPQYRKRTLWGATRSDGSFPPMRFFLGTGIAFFGISAVGEFKPEVAGPFAALVMTTAFMFNGVPALEYMVNGGAVPAGAPQPTMDPQSQTPSNPGTPVASVQVPVTYANPNRPNNRAKRTPAHVKIRMFANPNRPNNTGVSE